MHTNLLTNIGLVLGLGVAAQWVAWRIRQPSILILLIAGLLVGPVATIVSGAPLLDVDHFLGDLLFPFVSASVAIILFEGGLSLRLKDIRGTRWVVRNLVTVGVAVTGVLTSLAALLFLGLEWRIALLLGAVLVVTGPTVVIPLLNQIRPKGRVSSILRWEGIVIDPVGAILAVLIFEEILIDPNLLNLVGALLATIAIGGILGYVSSRLLVEVFSRYWVPDNLHIPVTLGVVMVVFAASNAMMPESGLLTVTIMGIAMANQDRYNIHRIVEFKEPLQVLLLSVLFVLLAGRMSPADLAQIGLPTVAFVAVLILVVRPVAAFISTTGSGLTWRERLFLSWMAPRGIVAASVASVFALELRERGFTDAEQIVPVTFAVIIGTVIAYSVTAGRLARRIGLAESDPQGVLIVGAHTIVRLIAREIQQAGFRVLLVDSSLGKVERARKEHLEVYHGNILSDTVEDEVDFSGIGRLLAMTRNTEVNALACEHFRGNFGSTNVFEVQRPNRRDSRDEISPHIGGRPLFPPENTFDMLDKRFRDGARVMTIAIDDVDVMQRCTPKAVVPLFVIPDDEQLLVWAADEPIRLQVGYHLIALVESEYYDELLQHAAIRPSADDLHEAAEVLQR